MQYINTHMSFRAANPHDLPVLPPRGNTTNAGLTNLLIKARAELGELKGSSFAMPNPFLFLSPAIIKESLASSEIENVNTTVINVLENQMFPESEQRPPDKEVLRYRSAVMWGYDNLQKYSISTRLVLGIESKLIGNKEAQYRSTQNGIENSRTHQLIYTPPVASSISALMGNLENYMSNPLEDVDPLIRCAISHYQFEAIHPFGDGNGRTGRILMVLQLVNDKVLNYPNLYVSGYINKNKAKYYEVLLGVTTKGDWNGYLEFIIQGFYEQAQETKRFLYKVMNAYHEFKSLLKSKHKNIYSGDLVEALFSYPIITPVKLASELGVYRDTATRYLNALVANKLLTEKKIGRYHMYANADLLRILHQ